MRVTEGVKCCHEHAARLRLCPLCHAAGLPHNDIAAQICRQAGLVKHPDGSKGGHGTADLLGVEDGQVRHSLYCRCVGTATEDEPARQQKWGAAAQLGYKTACRWAHTSWVAASGVKAGQLWQQERVLVLQGVFTEQVAWVSMPTQGQARLLQGCWLAMTPCQAMFGGWLAANLPQEAVYRSGGSAPANAMLSITTAWCGASQH